MSEFSPPIASEMMTWTLGLLIVSLPAGAFGYDALTAAANALAQVLAANPLAWLPSLAVLSVLGGYPPLSSV
jgi:uncharacterized membrane protein YtjA (UPF0391 family)